MNINQEIRNELREVISKRDWQVGAVLWATCIIGLIIKSLA